MAKYIIENPNLTQENFEQILQDSRLATFYNIYKDYPYSDFVENIRDHGASDIVRVINNYRSKNTKPNKPKKKVYISMDDGSVYEHF